MCVDLLNYSLLTKSKEHIHEKFKCHIVAVKAHYCSSILNTKYMKYVYKHKHCKHFTKPNTCCFISAEKKGNCCVIIVVY